MLDAPRLGWLGPTGYFVGFQDMFTVLVILYQNLRMQPAGSAVGLAIYWVLPGFCTRTSVQGLKPSRRGP